MRLKQNNLPLYSPNVVENRRAYILVALGLALFAISCIGSGKPSPSSPNTPPAAPVFSTTAAQNGAVILALSSASSGTTVHYIQERVDAAGNPDWNAGSIHGMGFTGETLGVEYHFPSGQTAAGWHTYGMIWQPGSIQYYIDDPGIIYATFTPASLTSLAGAVWPFDSGNAQFFILDLAVGGSWPGKPNNATPFPSQTLVDYVRAYALSKALTPRVMLRYVGVASGGIQGRAVSPGR